MTPPPLNALPDKWRRRAARVARRNPGIELRKPASGLGLAYFLFGTRGHVLRGRVVLAQIGVDSPEAVVGLSQSIVGQPAHEQRGRSQLEAPVQVWLGPCMTSTSCGVTPAPG